MNWYKMIKYCLQKQNKHTNRSFLYKEILSFLDICHTVITWSVFCSTGFKDTRHCFLRLVRNVGNITWMVFLLRGGTWEQQNHTMMFAGSEMFYWQHKRGVYKERICCAVCIWINIQSVVHQMTEWRSKICRQWKIKALNIRAFSWIQ